MLYCEPAGGLRAEWNGWDQRYPGSDGSGRGVDAQWHSEHASDAARAE